jgi:hypothetical protein
MLCRNLHGVSCLVHVFQTSSPSRRCLFLADHYADHALTQHIFPVHPRVYFHEQLRTVFTCSSLQLTLTPRMERQIWRDVIDFTLVDRPRRLAFPAVLLLQHGRRHTHQRVNAREVLARFLQMCPVKRRVTWREEHFASRVGCLDGRLSGGWQAEAAVRDGGPAVR